MQSQETVINEEVSSQHVYGLIEIWNLNFIDRNQDGEEFNYELEGLRKTRCFLAMISKDAD